MSTDGTSYLAGLRGGAKSIEVIENGVFDGEGTFSSSSPHWHPFAVHIQHPLQQDIFSTT